MSRKEPLAAQVPVDDPSVALKLFDPRTGDEAFRSERLSMNLGSVEPERTNFFSLYWIDSGAGTFWADAAHHAFQSAQLLCFVPYQRLRFLPTSVVDATLIQFHANFLCIETFHAEAGCSGTLFNDPYGPPIVSLSSSVQDDLQQLVLRLHQEFAEQRLGYRDAFLAALKLLLILAAREKNGEASADQPDGKMFRDPVIEQLRELIEQRYCQLHAPADYAALLHTAPKALGRLVKERLGKTLTDLIRERILTHAKWQLLHTLRPVKEIAAELGFHDELYFSRLFKKAIGFAPSAFREFETEIRGGSNMSMPSTVPSMPDAAPNVDN